MRFGVDSSQDDLPEKIYNDPVAWDEYMAHLWYNLLFFCDLQEKSTIIEVGPGASTKIARALTKISFSGTVYIVEPHPILGEKIYAAYQSLLPKATIYHHSTTLSDVIHKLPKSPHAIIASHALDDMMLLSSRYASLRDFDWACFGPTYPADTIQFESTWEKLKQDDDELERCKQHVLRTWEKTVQTIQPRYFLLSQYPSYFLSQHGFQTFEQHARDILEQLKQNYHNITVPQQTLQAILNSMKHYNNTQLYSNILNAENWLIGNTP